MVKLMRCNQPHWAGNTFVPVGTVLPEGNAGVIPQFFEEFQVDDGEAAEVVEDTGQPGDQSDGGEVAQGRPAAPAPRERVARRGQR